MAPFSGTTNVGARTTGTAPEQTAGWGWQTVHDLYILPNVMRQWTEASDSRMRSEMEFPLRSPDGAFRTFLTSVHPIEHAELAFSRSNLQTVAVDQPVNRHGSGVSAESIPHRGATFQFTVATKIFV